ncbi:MAG: hypothetical protein ACXVJ7_08520 [Acidimicrobiia bacterium]
MDETDHGPPSRNVIGGRHGSPSVTVAFPFSKVAHVDSELRGFVEELVNLVASLAAATTDAERRAVADASRELLDRMAPGD